MSLTIRSETPADRQQIFGLLANAFRVPSDPSAEPVEVGLTRELLAGADYVPDLSVVATVDDVVVGYVITTRARIGTVPSLGLGPIGVLPASQGHGVGSALMVESLRRAEALGEKSVALLGDPGFYHRFGFQPATGLGVAAPDPAWGDYFMVRAIGGVTIPVGEFVYADPFSRL
ncbi:MULTISPECIES: GNAT family N-acetyltransferase [unclassified Arthrobacter]|uniref:GNAT family N-acetyltransferase n=1 Tax=unclassified Arthrobacter TaxID=235627 RepID=UPI0014928C5E|nr:N-acetyltransferase [Arthrobacter sp. AET 35A]MBE0008985.1 N-acetyltransferase [Arthrobacter sp. AET 35A]NOJ62885.1 N-acetyltransferase [Arthrobacter sp. 147(2020)]